MCCATGEPIRIRSTLANAADARRLLSPGLADLPVEWMRVAYLGRGGDLILVTAVGGHSCDAVEMPVRDIVTLGLAVDAAGIVIAHNHPGGDPRPSRSDMAATRTLARATALLDMRLVDHLVFGGRECGSFRALGLL